MARKARPKSIPKSVWARLSESGKRDWVRDLAYERRERKRLRKLGFTDRSSAVFEPTVVRPSIRPANKRMYTYGEIKEIERGPQPEYRKKKRKR